MGKGAPGGETPFRAEIADKRELGHGRDQRG